MESQGVLLRILEEKRLLPLGGTSEVEVNVRLITATNKNLWKMAKEGTFREDLLFRLQEFTITTVPLREMMEDVAEIADALWRGRKGVPLPDGADEVLMTYSWPGNVRELSNFLKYADVMGHGNWRDVLSRYLENRGTEEKTGGEDIPGVMPVRLDEVAAWHCERVYQQCGSISRAAELLGIQRATLRRHLLKRGSKVSSWGRN